VVGAGMAGLAAAARLATRDNSVVVCEATDTVGGALGSWRHGDLCFDTGAHTLTLPAAYRDLFIKTGSRKKSAAATLEDRVDLRPLDPIRRYLFPDGTRLDLPNASRGRLVTAFDEALGIGAGEAWLRVVDHGSRVWDAIRPSLVESPGAGEREFARLLRTSTGRRSLTPLRSLRALASRWFASAPDGHPAQPGQLLLLLDDYVRQAGADPRRAPAVLAARIYIEQAFGAWRIVGGMHTLAEELGRRVTDRGAEVRYGARVSRIERSGSGAVSGVVLERGERLPADVVVAAVDQAVLAQLLGHPSPVRKDAYSASAMAMCLMVDETAVSSMPHETVLLDEERAALRIHVATEQPTAWTVHVPVSHQQEAEPDAVLGTLAARGIDVRGKARVLHIVTAADRQAATGVPGGAAYGPAANSLRAALLRSPVRQPVTGLFHVGASARPGSGLSFAALSGWHASELVKAETGTTSAN
jgi:phytoene dehydrogenase-like protein